MATSDINTNPEHIEVEQIILGFGANWNHANFGIDYSEKMWEDPVSRINTQTETERLLHKRFGDIGIGNPSPKPKPGINSYSDRFLSVLFGCRPVYQVNQPICVLPLEGDYDLLEKFDIPELKNSAIIEKAFTEADILTKEFGFCSAQIGRSSPLNVAFSTFGELFLAALAEEPALAQHVLQVVIDTYIKLYYELQNKIEPDVYPSDRFDFGYGNCQAIMISPEMYREVILPVDLEFRKRIDTFDLHHCGVFDKYALMYKELKPDKIDVGANSDYEYMREIFPDTPASLIIEPVDIEGKSREDIDRLVSKMIKNAAPYSLIPYIWTADFSLNMTDENIRDLSTAHLRI